MFPPPKKKNLNELFHVVRDLTAATPIVTVKILFPGDLQRPDFVRKLSILH